jgi:UDPglucose--hexose-1-phosphate uridylyltransferase
VTRSPDALLAQRPHRRRNPLTDEWVLVSPHRHQRPWQGAIEPATRTRLPAHDPGCYLCPGSTRANGERNPAYTSTYVFANDFPALLPDRAPAAPCADPLLTAQALAGECRVLCYSPRHDLSLGELSAEGRQAVIDAWAYQTLELERKWRWVQIFENRGELMGASNPHPHGQIWAGEFVPNEVDKELAQQGRWLAERGTPLLQDYAQLEESSGERVVIRTAHWLALVPWWAVWPFELLLLPRRSVQRLPDLNATERGELADLLGEVLRRYDALFGVPFPHSFGWHGAPSGAEPSAGCQLHAHFYPPLLRSATVRKFMVGYELLAEVQRDLTPEQAAERLRACANQAG